MNDDLPLGRRVAYPANYDPSVLRTIQRRTGRQEVGIGDPLPFQGEDVWNCYELSWLTPSGLPRVGILTLRVPADSPRIVESKSLKLYLGGFGGSTFEDSAAVCSMIEGDLSRETGSLVRVLIGGPDDAQRLGDFATYCLDDLPVSADRYERSPGLLTTTRKTGRDAVHTHLFLSANTSTKASLRRSEKTSDSSTSVAKFGRVRSRKCRRLGPHWRSRWRRTRRWSSAEDVALDCIAIAA